MKSGRLRPLLSSVVLRSQSDARLAALAADGHQLAFATIFERYERELRAHAARTVRPLLVDDVIQHSMLSAWGALLSGSQVDQLRPWLHRIVHNAALNTIARRGYSDVQLAETLASPAATPDLVEGRLTAGAALAAIAALPNTQRQALTLTALEGRSAREAATEMGLSESATRQLVYRARNGVRSAVSALTPLPLLLSTGSGAGGSAATLAGAGAVGSAITVAVKAATVIAVVTATLGAAGALPHHHAPAKSRAPHLTPISASTTVANEPVQPIFVGTPALTRHAAHPGANPPAQSRSHGGSGASGSHGESDAHGANGSAGSAGSSNSGQAEGSSNSRQAEGSHSSLAGPQMSPRDASESGNQESSNSATTTNANPTSLLPSTNSQLQTTTDTTPSDSSPNPPGPAGSADTQDQSTSAPNSSTPSTDASALAPNPQQAPTSDSTSPGSLNQP